MPIPSDLDPDLLPKHIAIIMDGNGRWAQQRGLMRIMGHKAGVESVRDIVKAADRLGIKVLTLYAFSTENWKRPAMEVSGLMNLLQSYLKSELDDMKRNNIRLRCIGQSERLPRGPRAVLDRSIKETEGNTGLILNLALSYGSREEIVRAVKSIARQCIDGTLAIDEITDKTVSENLYTTGIQDPDLIIRTGGEHRLSNFLLWQASYAELHVTRVMWPEFRAQQLFEALLDFQNRQRRYGMTQEQVAALGN